MSVAVIGQFRMPPEQMDAARAMMRKVMEASRAEAGCIEYNYAEDVLDPGLIRVSEVWESRDHLMAHAKSQ
ncbi:MAG: antibiotic biosynthesis monooxygenase, partial [Proteobacteria bacterium]|nr:antibiotic biosynthesis monooxygenase [Pseudomonadota bacterium]